MTASDVSFISEALATASGEDREQKSSQSFLSLRRLLPAGRWRSQPTIKKKVSRFAFPVENQIVF